MASSPTLTADEAKVPAAVPAFQRSPSPSIRYRKWDEARDLLGGIRSRRDVLASIRSADLSSYTLDTPWLQALGDEARGHLEGERRATNAMLATLDHALASAYEGLSNLQAQRGRLADVRSRVEGADATPDPKDVASDGAVVATRRANDGKAARLADATGAVAEIDNQMDTLKVEISALLEDRAWQWMLLLVRAAQIMSHFDRRAAVWAARATRGASLHIAATRCERPTWLSEPAPPAPLPKPGAATLPAN